MAKKQLTTHLICYILRYLPTCPPHSSAPPAQHVPGADTAVSSSYFIYVPPTYTHTQEHQHRTQGAQPHLACVYKKVCTHPETHQNPSLTHVCVHPRLEHNIPGRTFRASTNMFVSTRSCMCASFVSRPAVAWNPLLHSTRSTPSVEGGGGVCYNSYSPLLRVQVTPRRARPIATQAIPVRRVMPRHTSAGGPLGCGPCAGCSKRSCSHAVLIAPAAGSSAPISAAPISKAVAY